MSVFLDRYGLFSIACIMALAFLAVDILLPLGVAGGVFYVAVILISRWFPSRHQVANIILITVILTIIGYFFSPEGGILWKVLFNRGLALFAIIATGFVIYYEKKAGEQARAEAEQVDKDDAQTSLITAPNIPYKAHDQIHSTGYQGAIVVLPILLIIIGITFWISYKSEEAARWVSHSHQVNNALSQVLSTFQDAETGQRGFLLTGNLSYLEPFTNAIARQASLVNRVRWLTSDNPSQQQRLDQAIPLIDEKLAVLQQTITLMKTQGLPSALNLVESGRGKVVMDDLRTVIAEMEIAENKLLMKRSQLLERNELLALSAQLIGFVLIILIGVFVMFRVRFLHSMRTGAEEQLTHMANHDALTGLATRRLGMEYISFALATADRNKSKAAVLFIDLDGFKVVNDKLGHEAGDAVLVGVAERLLNCVREIDAVVRIGGDEFIVVLNDIHNRDNAALIAQKLIAALAQSFTFGDKNVTIGASIGIALYPDHEQDPEALLKRADDAMYEIKNQEKNNFAFASDE